MIGGYFGLLSYCEIKANNLLKEEKIAILNWYIDHANNKIYDMINYELLIYIELSSADDKEILEKVIYLKQLIAKNYLLKEKLKNRLSLKEPVGI